MFSRKGIGIKRQSKRYDSTWSAWHRSFAISLDWLLHNSSRLQTRKNSQKESKDHIEFLFEKYIEIIRRKSKSMKIIKNFSKSKYLSNTKARKPSKIVSIHCRLFGSFDIYILIYLVQYSNGIIWCPWLFFFPCLRPQICLCLSCFNTYLLILKVLFKTWRITLTTHCINWRCLTCISLYTLSFCFPPGFSSMSKNLGNRIFVLIYNERNIPMCVHNDRFWLILIKNTSLICLFLPIWQKLNLQNVLYEIRTHEFKETTAKIEAP